LAKTFLPLLACAATSSLDESPDHFTHELDASDKSLAAEVPSVEVPDEESEEVHFLGW